ncbi:helix-turn-helix domain-containing protein [Polaromonas sp. P1(28)-13]|nr:helix-turn-helix domain-containing protein [Polaromonas sp. P1(28)-13]
MNTPYESARFKLVTKADAAQVFSVCTKTIDNYIKAGLIPPPIQFGAKEYWHPEEFHAHLNQVFRKGSADALEGESQKPTAEETPPILKTKANSTRDSSASIRQQARQAAKLKRLNS